RGICNSGCFWNKYQPAPIPSNAMSTETPASIRSAEISSAECVACVVVTVSAAAGACASDSTDGATACSPPPTVATAGSSVCSITFTSRSANTELNAYGTPIKPPTVDNTASTISGNVITHGDSCGSTGP